MSHCEGRDRRIPGFIGQLMCPFGELQAHERSCFRGEGWHPRLSSGLHMRVHSLMFRKEDRSQAKS